MITLLVALGAFNSQNNLLFWTFGLALSALLVSGFISGSMLMGVEVARETIGEAGVGDDLRIRYRIRNTNRLFPVFALTIEEAGFTPPEQPGRIARLLRRKPTLIAGHPIAPPLAFVVHVGAGETVHADTYVRALRRGPVSFTEIVVHSSFPFGLMRKLLRFAHPGATVIRPAIIEPESGVLGAGSAVGLVGAVARRPGTGDEFFSLREYVPGDGTRGIAWAASARRGSLLVRQNAAPTPLRLWIVLRLRTASGSSEQDERAISLAAGLARRAELRGMDYGLSIPLTRSLTQPRRGLGHLARLMTDLGLLDLGADDGRGSTSAFPPHAGAPSTLCIVVHSGRPDPSYRPAGNRESVTHIGTDNDASATNAHARAEEVRAA